MDTRRAFLPLLTGLLTAHGVRASDGAELKITVHLVWASDVATAGKGKDEHALPAELEAKLREKTKQKHFRLDARPTTSSLEPDKPVETDLPSGYKARWTLTLEKDRPVVRQVLVNPEKKESVVDLKRVDVKKGPYVYILEKVKRGEETLFLVIQFETSAKKK